MEKGVRTMRLAKAIKRYNIYVKYTLQKERNPYRNKKNPKKKECGNEKYKPKKKGGRNHLKKKGKRKKCVTIRRAIAGRSDSW